MACKLHKQDCWDMLDIGCLKDTQIPRNMYHILLNYCNSDILLNIFADKYHLPNYSLLSIYCNYQRYRPGNLCILGHHTKSSLDLESKVPDWKESNNFDMNHRRNMKHRDPDKQNIGFGLMMQLCWDYILFCIWCIHYQLNMFRSCQLNKTSKVLTGREDCHCTNRIYCRLCSCCSLLCCRGRMRSCLDLASNLCCRFGIDLEKFRSKLCSFGSYIFFRMRNLAGRSLLHKPDKHYWHKQHKNQSHNYQHKFHYPMYS